MNNVFIDSNIWLYAFIDSGVKTEKSHNILSSNKNIVISTQVINEVSFNLLKKLKFDEIKIKNVIDDFYTKYEIINFSEKTLNTASDIRSAMSVSFWDSHIISCALISGCNLIYSEDLQNNFSFDNKLKIINPFL